jgi:hypothetical protein
MDNENDALSRRRFSEGDLRAILARAAELQQGGVSDSADEASGANGVSLAELEEVGRDVGIDPSLIRQAARDVSERGTADAGTGPVAAFLGAPPRREERRDLDVSLSQDDLQDLLVHLDAAMGEAGQGMVSRSTLSWSTDAAVAMRNGMQTSVRIYTGPKGSSIRVVNDMSNAAGGLFGGLMGGVGLGAGLGIGLGVGLETLESVPFAILTPVLLLGASYVLARTIFTGIFRGRRRKLTRTADELAATAQSLSESSTQGE